jgi:hypothetical protein
MIERMIESYPAAATIIPETAHGALTVGGHLRGPLSTHQQVPRRSILSEALAGAARQPLETEPMPRELWRWVRRLLRIGWTMKGGLAAIRA